MILTDAVIMSVKPILENDLLVELLTESVGRIRAFAKYAQSNKPRFGGLLATFNHVSVRLYESKTSFKLSDVQIVDGFNSLKSNFEALSTAYSIIEVVRTMTQIGIENQALFKQTKVALKRLNTQPIDSEFLKEFYYFLLKSEGLISEEVNLNEKDYKKMIESYTGIKLRNQL